MSRAISIAAHAIRVRSALGVPGWAYALCMCRHTAPACPHARTLLLVSLGSDPYCISLAGYTSSETRSSRLLYEVGRTPAGCAARQLNLRPRNTTPQGRGAPGTILAARLLEIRAGQRRRLASLCPPARQIGLARALGTLFPPNHFQVRLFCLAYSSALVSPITLDPAPPEFHLSLSLWPPVILWRQLPTWRSSFSRHRLPYSSRSLTVSTAPPLKLVRFVHQGAAVGT
jgi:hypothetical protein